MKIKLKIRVKLLLSVLLIATVTYAVSIGYLINKLQSNSLRDSYEKADLNAQSSANLVRTFLNHDMDLSRAMVHSMHNFRQMPQNQRVQFFKDMIYGIAKENPNLVSVWGSWEINALDSTYTKPHGRHRYTMFNDKGELKFQEATLNLEGDDIGSSYHKIKMSKTEEMINPYWFSYTDDSGQILEASTGVPLLENGEFRGLFGFDIPLDRYQTITNSIQPFEGSYSIMLSNNGTIVGYPDENLLGELYSKYFSTLDNEFSITTNVTQGNDFSFTMLDSITGEPYYATFAAIPIGNTKTPWSFGIVVPASVLQQEAKSITQNALIISIIGIIILAVIVWLMAFTITKPLIKAKYILGEMAKGRIDSKNKILLTTGDEIEDISQSINTLIDGLSVTSEFAREIGKGNLNQQYSKLSDGDILGESLLDMQKSLLHAQEMENLRKIEDDKISWATSGMAKFAEILRQNNDNIEEFSYQLISNLAKYVNANVAALFLFNDENTKDLHFELVASYAYERRKFIDKRIELGEGLVGRCAQEKETIFMTELPDDYIKISSGLGYDNPNSLLIVPLKLNEVVYGVLELASLELFEKYIIDFVEKIGESIAATISTVKINMKTVKLLEESKIKSEELASQEEEMRQNMEELQATQEESARKTAEMESLINALHASSYVIEYDTKGTVTSVNDAYLKLTNQTADQLIGTHHSDNLLMDEKQLKEYKIFWDNLRNGIIKKEKSQLKLGEKVYTFIETYSPIYDENRKVVKVLKIAHNITDFIGQEGN
ncbi:MAG: GAF domain-containing protein [Tenuifilaceae bacterium]|jgi:methyl-accepting chemotaxis protein|nr:GAF domain-containing protein [Tenuifilaceae bacterium]